jgi:hypothetical protein
VTDDATRSERVCRSLDMVRVLLNLPDLLVLVTPCVASDPPAYAEGFY